MHGLPPALPRDRMARVGSSIAGLLRGRRPDQSSSFAAAADSTRHGAALERWTPEVHRPNPVASAHLFPGTSVRCRFHGESIVLNGSTH